MSGAGTAAPFGGGELTLGLEYSDAHPGYTEEDDKVSDHKEEEPHGHKDEDDEHAEDSHSDEGGMSFTYLQGIFMVIAVLMVLMWLARRGNTTHTIIKEKSIV